MNAFIHDFTVHLYTILLHSDWIRVSKNTIFQAQNTIFQAKKTLFFGLGGHDCVFVFMVAAPLFTLDLLSQLSWDTGKAKGIT